MNRTPGPPDNALIDICLRGQGVWGEDFSPEEVRQWFADEAEGYAELGAQNETAYRYGYHGLNWYHGFRHLAKGRIGSAMSLGGAYGDELLPVVERLDQVTIVEASQRLRRERLGSLPIIYVDPDPSGRLPFPDRAFDLVTCLGVLHHLPKVSTVLRELFRCTVSGGHVLVREPIGAMGDWRGPRRGLTKRERGIPLGIFRALVQEAGFTTAREGLCQFPTTSRIGGLLRRPAFSSPALTLMDHIMCLAFQWNYTYNPMTFWRKLRPGSVFLVLRRP